MALQAGLSAGIINPNAKAMMQSYDTYMVLSGNDSQCTKYIEKYAVAPETAETNLRQRQISVSRIVLSRDLKKMHTQKPLNFLKLKHQWI